MRIERYKRAQKALQWYARNFQIGLKNHFNILVDGTFCMKAIRARVPISDQLEKLLKGHVRLYTTTCAVIETQRLGLLLRGPLMIIKEYAIVKCGHEKKPVSASTCFLSLLKNGNSSQFFVATQDHELAKLLGEIPGIPRLFIHQTIAIDDPSPASLDHVNKRTQQQLAVPEFQLQSLKKLKEEKGLLKEEGPIRKRKGPKGPNPLSCLRKKPKQPDASVVSTSDTERRKRPARKRRKRHQKNEEISNE